MTARSHLFTAQDAAVNSTAALSVESHTSLDEAAVSSIITGRPSTTSPLQVGASLPRKCTLAPCCAYLRAGCLTLAPRVLILSSTRVRSPVRSSRCAGRRANGDAKLDGAPAAACASLGPPWTVARGTACVPGLERRACGACLSRLVPARIINVALLEVH